MYLRELIKIQSHRRAYTQRPKETVRTEKEGLAHRSSVAEANFLEETGEIGGVIAVVTAEAESVGPVEPKRGGGGGEAGGGRSKGLSKGEWRESGEARRGEGY
jgi:hypothetical protein